MDERKPCLIEGVDTNEIYRDHAGTSTVIYDRRITSCYTPYGIKRIDSQFCKLIQNVNLKVKQLYAINRRPSEYCDIKTRKVHEFYLSHQTYYDPIELDDNYCEVRVEWENGDMHDFYYGDKPVFDVKIRKSDPKQLEKQIKQNQHLHSIIKNNLLLNLTNYLEHGY